MSTAQHVDDYASTAAGAASYARAQRAFWASRISAAEADPAVSADFDMGYIRGQIAAYSAILDLLVGTREDGEIMDQRIELL